MPQSVDDTVGLLNSGDYLADRSLATVVFLALKMSKPLLLEGEPGTGKTEIAKVLAQTLDRNLIRLQCYEGLDAASAVYEWNYARQMLAIRLAESDDVSKQALTNSLFGEKYIIKRPLLQALEAGEQGPSVLLIDEVDRTDEPFEAYLLEILSDFQVTIPEYGTVKAAEPPIVIITSNRTREIHDALKRRCFYHWVGYPAFERERTIVERRLPHIGDQLAHQVVAFVQRLRERELFKLPGIAETLDWAQTLSVLNHLRLEPEVVDDTLGALLKYQDDIARMQGSEAAALVAAVQRDYNEARVNAARQQ
jgi:MoxR-like ATPase